jgi:tetratricopeptide (TPR) repeat protein
LLQLARAYCNASKDTLAVVQFRKLVQIAPQANYFAELAVTYVRLNKGSDAHKAVQSALELAADDEMALMAQILVTVHLKDLEAAKGQLQAALTKVHHPHAQNWLKQVESSLEKGEAPADDVLQQIPTL